MSNKKVLTRRLYHYTALLRRSTRPLYGNVRVDTSHSPMDWVSYISIVYKAAQDGSFPIARIYRAVDEATLFEVYGIGTQRNHDPALRQKVARWKRYAPVFTPLPDGERLYDGERRYYLLRQDGSTALLTEKPGVWRGSESLLTRKSVDRWLNYDAKLRNYPLFLKRARRFVRRLADAMDGLPCKLCLRNGGGIPAGNKRHIFGPHLSVDVSTPPVGKQDGRTLGVEMYMYDREARQHHHVDGDYGMKHCHYLACQTPEPGAYRSRHPLLRWKCGNDAIVGIKEWIIGDIFIPGPG